MTIVLPDFLGNDSGIIPIQLLASRELQLEILKEKPFRRIAETDRQDRNVVSRQVSVDTAVLEKKMEELSLAENLRVPSPDVLLPSVEHDRGGDGRHRTVRSFPSYRRIAKAFEETRKPETGYEGIRPSIDASPDVIKGEKTETDSGAERILGRLRYLAEEGPQ